MAISDPSLHMKLNSLDLISEVLRVFVGFFFFNNAGTVITIT